MTMRTLLLRHDFEAPNAHPYYYTQAVAFRPDSFWKQQKGLCRYKCSTYRQMSELSFQSSKPRSSEAWKTSSTHYSFLYTNAFPIHQQVTMNFLVFFIVAFSSLLSFAHAAPFNFNFRNSSSIAPRQFEGARNSTNIAARSFEGFELFKNSTTLSRRSFEGVRNSPSTTSSDLHAPFPKRNETGPAVAVSTSF